MAQISYTTKDGLPYISIDGQEYPILSNWDTKEPSSGYEGFVPTGDNSGYYLNGAFANSGLPWMDDLALSKQDNMQGFIEAGKQNFYAQDKANAIAGALALAAMGGVAAPAFAGGGAASAGVGSATDAEEAARLMAEYGGQGASYGGSGVGTMQGVGTSAYDAAANAAFNAGNTLGEGGTAATLSPDSYWNPVTNTEMPYGEVGSVGEPGFMSAETPWYEKFATSLIDNPTAASSLANALYNFTKEPTISGGGSGMPNLSGLTGGSGGSSGGGSGVSQSQSITPQQLALPEFTKFDNPLGVQYRGLDMLNNPYAQALRSY